MLDTWLHVAAFEGVREFFLAFYPWIAICLGMLLLPILTDGLIDMFRNKQKGGAD